MQIQQEELLVVASCSGKVSTEQNNHILSVSVRDALASEKSLASTLPLDRISCWTGPWVFTLS
jgi:hypothetical protein